MRRIIAAAILALVITASAFAGYIGVEVGIGFNTRDIKIKNDKGEYIKKYTDNIGFTSLTAIGEIMDYAEEIGFGGEATFEMPLAWERYGKDLDLSDHGLSFRQACIYAIIPSGIYYTSTFNVDAGIFYRREALASQVGGHTCHSLGVMAKMEYVLDNPSFVIPRIGFKMQMPLLSFTRGETRVIVDGISIGAYVTIGFGE